MAFLLLFSVFFFTIGCSLINSKKEDIKDEKINIVTSEFIEYDFAKQIVKDKANVSMLLPVGVEGHDYEANATDILNVSKADIFFFSGLKAEPWVDKIINSFSGDRAEVIDISSNVNFLKTKINNSKESIDPHIYLDLNNAKIMLENTLETICKKDPINTEFYKENANRYKEKISRLDLEIKKLTDSSRLKKIAFAGRFAGIYFTKRYSLNYISAYPSCEFESEPDANKILEIISFIKSNKIPVIFYEDLKDQKLANAISKETNARVLKFNTVHTVDKPQFDAGVTYVDLMQENLDNLRQALI